MMNRFLTILVCAMVLNARSTSADEGLNYTVLSRQAVLKSSEDFSAFLAQNSHNRNDWDYTFHPIYQELFGPINAVTNPVKDVLPKEAIRRIKVIFKDSGKRAHLLAVAKEVEGRKQNDSLEQPGKEDLKLLTLVQNFEGNGLSPEIVVANEGKPSDPTKNFPPQAPLLGSAKTAALRGAESKPASSEAKR